MFAVDEETRYRLALEDRTQHILEHVTRGIEAYALWHKCDVSQVRIVDAYFSSAATLVVVYAVCR